MEEPGPLAFARENVHLIRHQEPEDERRWRIIWGRRGEDTRETEGPTTSKNPRCQQVPEHSLRAEKGGEWTQDTEAEVFTRRGVQR